MHQTFKKHNNRMTESQIQRCKAQMCAHETKREPWTKSSIEKGVKIKINTET